MRRSRRVVVLAGTLLLAVTFNALAQEIDGANLTSAKRALTALYDLQQALRAVAKAVLPVVVKLDTEATLDRGPTGDQGRPEFPVPGVGSGVLIRRDGERYFVLTNNHVVVEAERITVTLNGDRSFPAEVVGTDNRMDLAIISFETADELPLAELGDSDGLRAGDIVLAVGSPFGLEATVTSGIVSAVSRSGGVVGNISDFIQTDANINPGNSGGALVDISGKVVGINTWIQAQRGLSVGVGFALPINNVKPVIDQLIDIGTVRYAWLGVAIGGTNIVGYLSPGRNGVVLFGIFDGQPAANAGLLPGDVVLAVANKEMHDSDDLARMIAALEPGVPVTFRLVRDGAEQTVMVEPGLRGDDQDVAVAWPGIRVHSLQALTARARSALPDVGVFVLSVTRSTATAASGLQPRDTIVRIDGVTVSDLRDFYRLINTKPDGVFTVEAVREGRTRTFLLKR